MNSDGNSEESLEDCILYELLVYAEWRQDPELLKYPKTGDLVNYSNNHSSKLKRALSYFGQRDTFHNDIFRILLRQLPWHFAVGEGGKVVAILQEMYLEIRTSRDEYSSVVGKASISKDPNLQWRKLAWSPDCSMLALAHSNGVVSFYDLLGSNIFNIYPPKFQQDASVEGRNAIASIIFQQSRRKGPKWSSELVLVDYEGKLRAYLVSPTEGYQESHTFSFCNYYRQGIVMAAYHPAHNMLFLAGPPSVPMQDSLKNHGSSVGLSAWRLLNDYPYYRHSLSSDEEQAITLAQRRWWNWMPQVLSSSKQIIIFKMQVSPKGSLLACLHSCGSISIWHLPTMRLFKKWALHEQPGYDTRNPLHSEFSEKYQNTDFYPVDINWWSEKAVIIARYSGSVSVCSIGNLNNLLGESPEFLAGPPQVSALCSDHGFLGLECEVHLASKKSFWGEHITVLDKDIIEDVDDDDDDDEDEDMSFLNRSSALIRSAVYMVTDMERFQPKRKRPKLCYKTYRLLGLKSTTPEELYARKIDNEEYGEALALAKAYNLDCDLVYQRQWRNDKVSIATIHDYLSKVSKRWWVLKECLERVPESYAAAQELLHFGLEWTSLETFLSLGKGADGRDSSPEPLESSENTHLLDKDEQLSSVNKIKLSKVDVEKLTEEQKDLVQYRQQLLHYLDRLTTYEQILGGPSSAESNYDYVFYQKFRNASILDSTAEFAQEGKWQAVEIMFTFHGDITLSHWLPVLSNFPETMNPQEYKSLLPSSNSDGEVFLWTQDVLREKDWCEEDKFLKAAGFASEESADLLYESDPELKSFIWESDSITCELLSKWYTMRVYQIESRSCMVDHALTLLKLARINNIKGLDSLFFELQTLYTLVYEVQLEHIGLSELHKMTPLEKAKLLMSKSQEATFVENLKNLLLPFLSHCENLHIDSRRHLLHEYFVDISSTDLSMPVRAFEYICDEQHNSLVPTLDEKISLALDCLYAYPNADQLDKALKILECVTSRARSVESNIGADLHQKLTELHQELHAAEILDRNSLQKPLSYIHDCKSNSTFAEQLLVKLARNTAKRVPPPTTPQWKELLKDMLDLQSECFSCVSIGVCFEIYVATLLSSGSKENIRAAGDILECKRVTWSSKNVPYNRSVALVLQAAMEYLDSAGSLTDPSMDLAKACLHLITDENPEIEEKLDFIAALQMLSDFGLAMLPLQVRLCKDRLRLVESCIRSKPTAYRNSQRLLQLAYKLRVCGNDSRQREGSVLTLIAETALQMEDYSYCAEICQQLALKHHIRGWQVVKDLAQREDFSNLEVKYELLAFALLHCPPEAIEDLIVTRCLLEARILHQRINNHIQQREAEINSADEDEFSDALTSPLTPNKEFLPVSAIVHAVGDSTEIIRKTTYSLLKNVGNKNFWKARISWMTVNADEKSDQDEQQEHFLVQGFPTFYASLLSLCHLSCLDATYRRFVAPDIKVPELKLCQLLLRTTLLEDTAMQDSRHDNTEVLIQLSIHTLADDGCLGLAYLLTLPDITYSDKCFTSISSTAISLQLAMYYYALQGAKSIIGSEDLFLQDPNALMECMIKVDSEEKWSTFLSKYQNMLQDFLQGEQLQKLGCGVNLQRFTHDIQYQQDTILGLAMTIDKDRFALALTLGSRHGIPMEDVAAAHVVALLLNRDELPFGELAARLADEQLIRLLRGNPTTVCDRLMKHAYPDIDGKDHQLLLLYFTLLQSVIDDVSIHGLTPKEHIKLLKKVRATSPELDYKKLINPSNNILDVLKPALEKSNVGLIAKLVKSMPSSIIGTFNEGQVYVLWAQKEFFQIADNTNITDEKCLKQFEACSSHFNRMLPNDVLAMVKGICFGEQSLKLMSVNCRKRMILLAKDLCEQRTQLDKRENWSEAIRTLQLWYMHLHELSSSEAAEFCKECSPEGRLLFRMLDLTRGEAGPVNQFLKAAVLSEQSLDSLQKLLMLVPKPTPTMNNLLQNMFKDAVTKLRSGDKEEGSKLLVAVLRRMQESVANNNVDVPEEVEAICGDVNLPPDIRLQALNLLQSLRPNADRSDSLLLYHHTQAMVASAWPHSNFQIQGTDVASSQSRASLFHKLMQQTESWPQFVMLANLLTKWPQFDDIHVRELGTNPWMQLLQRMLLSEEKNVEQLKGIIENVFAENTFPEDHIKHVVSSTEGSTELELLLLICLLSDNDNLYSTAISLIQKHLQVKQHTLSKQILSLLLQKGLAKELVSTPVYRQLMELLISKENGEIPSSNTVANQLQAAGSIPEAGMLHLLSKNVSPALMVFSASLAMLKSSSCK